MRDKLKGIFYALAAVTGLGIGGVAIADATSGGDAVPSAADAAETRSEPAEAADPGEGERSDASEQATGARADAAARAALQAVGGGRVLEVERADDGGTGYEVEIERPDGSYDEVGLDADLRVLGTAGED